MASLHEGVRAYAGWLNGFPPIEPSLNDCHCETVRVFYYCQSVAAEQSNDQKQLDMGMDMVNRLLVECGSDL